MNTESFDKGTAEQHATLTGILDDLHIEELRRFGSVADIDPQHHAHYLISLEEIRTGIAGEHRCHEEVVTTLYKKSWEKQLRGELFQPTYRRALAHFLGRAMKVPPYVARTEIHRRCGIIQYQGDPDCA